MPKTSLLSFSPKTIRQTESTTGINDVAIAADILINMIFIGEAEAELSNILIINGALQERIRACPKEIIIPITIPVNPKYRRRLFLMLEFMLTFSSGGGIYLATTNNEAPQTNQAKNVIL